MFTKKFDNFFFNHFYIIVGQIFTINLNEGVPESLCCIIFAMVYCCETPSRSTGEPLEIVLTIWVSLEIVLVNCDNLSDGSDCRSQLQW